MNVKIFWLVVFVLCSCKMVHAQKNNVQKDSSAMYKNIEAYSKKRKFSKFVHKLIFRSIGKNKSNATDENRVRISKSYKENNNKIIRNIVIETLDPFGFSVIDTLRKPNNSFERFGNKVHLKTKKWTIKNVLLIKNNQPLDSLLVKESERLLRSQRYVSRVMIEPISITNNQDSVDVYVRVLDSWSLIPTGSFSGSKTNFEITERNFFGFGHEVKNDFSTRFSDKAKGYDFEYKISNVYNTFINTSIFYNNDLDKNVRKGIIIERKFYSPLVKNAGGIFVENRFFRDFLPSINLDYALVDFKNEMQEYWFGHAVKLFSGDEEDFRTTKLIATFSYKNIKYLVKPDEIYDPALFINSEKDYLISIGVNTQKFAQDKYLFNFGQTEDVPFGQVFSITAGFQDKNFVKRSYFGGKISYGNFYRLGYFSSSIEMGSFFNNGKSQETTLRFELNYFTNLMFLGNWKMRQFINPSFVFGTNRNQNIKDRITINENNGLNGFSSAKLLGTKKWITSFQTQLYSPNSWNGFRFNPYVNITLGMIGDDQNWLSNRKLYSSFGIGVLINNDYLVFNSFQLSFSYFPSIPNDGSNIIKTNAFKNNDLALPNYQIGKPEIVPFN